MPKRTLPSSTLLCSLLVATAAYGQTAPTPPAAVAAPGAPLVSVDGPGPVGTQPACCCNWPQDCSGETCRLWADVGYLLWWINHGPLSAPLVTTGNPANPLAGNLGQPDTRVLFGGNGLDYGTFSGLRATLGFWLDCEQTVGLEAGGFLLEQRSANFAAASDATGVPPLVVPFFDPLLNIPTGTVISASAGKPFAGSVAITSQSRLWSCQAEGVLALNSSGPARFDLLAGYRHAQLEENLNLSVNNQDLLFDIQNHYADRFATRNQFDGGQFGARLAGRWERFTYSLEGQVALGNTYQIVDRSGTSLQTGIDAFAPGLHPGGILVQQTNLGRLSHNVFTVLPTAEARIGVDLTPGLTASVGYSFLYWSSVARPGGQIDTTVNPSQSAISGGGVLVGPARPAPVFDHSDFFAHGLNFSLEFRF